MSRVLADAGYHTYFTGKWHLGDTQEHSPFAAGFDRSFSLLHGAASHFSSVGFFAGGSLYSRDGQPAERPDAAYSSELFTDELIGFIESNSNDGQPFFAVAAYTAPHAPLQVPDDYLHRYSGRYDDGYDALRERRFEELKRAGIVAADARIPPRNPAIMPWSELSESRRRVEARKMEVYAALVENLDVHVGRLLDYLRTEGLSKNTLVIFLSDNGAAAEGFYNRGIRMPYVRRHYDNDYDNMGKPGSWVSYGAPWAETIRHPARCTTHTALTGTAYYALAVRSGTPATINPPRGVPRSALPPNASKLRNSSPRASMNSLARSRAGAAVEMPKSQLSP